MLQLSTARCWFFHRVVWQSGFHKCLFHYRRKTKVKTKCTFTATHIIQRLKEAPRNFVYRYQMAPAFVFCTRKNWLSVETGSYIPFSLPIFSELCDSYTTPLPHTEVRSLSRGRLLLLVLTLCSEMLFLVFQHPFQFSSFLCGFRDLHT